MNRQEVYEKVRKHLLTQNHRSLNIKGCAYRGENGDKCAIGALIPDESYYGGLEGLGVAHASVLGATGLEIEDQTDVEYLTSLQVIHDMAPVEDWEDELDALIGGPSL